MNLVLSGPIDQVFLAEAIAAAQPSGVTTLNARAYRLKGVRTDNASRSALWSLCETAQVDHAYIETGQTLADFRVLAMDMDSTLITIECIDELADFAGRKPEVAAITEATMRGDITDFAESLRRRVLLLKGLDARVLERVLKERLLLSPGAVPLLEEAASKGIYRLLVSGGFTYFTDSLNERFRFDSIASNQLEIRDGKLTGSLVPPICTGETKAQALRQAKYVMDASATQTIAVGDGANDIQMLQEAGFSVAYHASRQVELVATHMIRYGGLDVLLDYLWKP